MTKPIQGVLPIAHTPFLSDDSIDVSSLRRQIDWAYEVGADGFGTGMVSELLRLTFDERIELTEKLGEINAGRGAYFAGVGAESTKQAIQYAQCAERAGADAVMAIPPISTRLPVSAVRDYFVALAESVSIPVIASGGAGGLDHFFDVFTAGKADAALAASIFHFAETSVHSLKAFLKGQGIPVRL